jgi:hypothetical protein
MEFQSQQEIWQALIDGKKVCHKESTEFYVFLEGGEPKTFNIGRQEISSVHWHFATPSDWKIYHPPKQVVDFMTAWKHMMEGGKAECSGVVYEIAKPKAPARFVRVMTGIDLGKHAVREIEFENPVMISVTGTPVTDTPVACYLTDGFISSQWELL